ncbi:hypothetical protein CLU79DRAFT_711369 [Phycomyces nitens]|nr:hypothetical protein CLU79DRAFT_711369 [Phycomyces nitens]
MVLATFGIITRRWKPTYLAVDSYASYRGLADHIPENLFNQRITDLNLFIKKNYPHVYPDSYMFLIALFLIVLAAVFSIVTRVLDISLWYPLLILIAPALIAYWTTRRRSLYYLRLSKFYDHLHTHLKEVSSNDSSHYIRWGYRRLRNDDTSESLHLEHDITHWRIVYVIEIIQLDPEVDHSYHGREVLPSYNAACQDVLPSYNTVSQNSPQNDTSPDTPQNATSPETPQNDTSPDTPQNDTSPDTPQNNTSPDTPQNIASPDTTHTSQRTSQETPSTTPTSQDVIINM